jgi:hypothetical protein
MLLVDLDRVDAAVAGLVAVVADRVLEAADQRTDAAIENVGKAHQERQTQTAPLQIQHQLVHVDARATTAERCRFDVPQAVDTEVTAGPPGDVVQLGGILDGPLADLFHGLLSLRKRNWDCSG